MIVRKLLVVAIATLSLVSASTGLCQSRGRINACVTLDDNTFVVGELIGDGLIVTTDYGELKVPFVDVISIKPAFVNSDEDEKAVIAAIKLLKSSIYKDRLVADTALVTFGKKAVRLLREIPFDPTEQATNEAVKSILQKICSKDPSTSDLEFVDTVVTRKFPIVGRIKSESLKIKTKHIGEQSLKFSAISTISMVQTGSFVMSVNADPHSRTDNWFDTGLPIISMTSLNLTAQGQIDLWPSQPGQHICGPLGASGAGQTVYGTTAVDGGALIGRIGVKGTPFLVGDKCAIITDSRDSGTLRLMINPSAWKATAAGRFDVTITIK